MFDSEMELVNFFVDNYSSFDEKVIVKEMPIRFGNIDVVSIENTYLPFSDEQTIILSKPSNSLVFTKIKNNRPLGKKTLHKVLGLSDSTLEHALHELLVSNLIKKNANNQYTRAVEFVFPKTIISGYEAKLTDFNKAFYQAKGNRNFVDYSYLVFPMKKAQSVKENKINLIEKNGIGLIGVDKNKAVQLVRPLKINKMKNHIRLLNLTKASVLG
ncbi:hypothetical protein C5I31_15685, partial [Listeria monocytogenes]|nr:hypothetical protein [Listeria monocytogenes]